MSTTNIKTILNHPTKGQDIRRFQLGSLDKPYDQLLKALTEIYLLPPQKLTLRYRDDDGDDCSISSNIELLEAFRIAHNDGRSLLKVDISVDEDIVKEDASTPGKTDPALERAHSQSSEEGFVKVEFDEVKLQNLPAESSVTSSASSSESGFEIKLISPEISSPSLLGSVQPIEPTVLEPLVAENSGFDRAQAILSEPIIDLRTMIEEKVNIESPEESVKIPEASIPVPEDVKDFPSRAEFFSLLAEFIHDSKVMEAVQMLLPGVLKLVDEDVRPPVTEILKNIFDFAPAIKENPLTLRLLPYTNQLATDPKMQPLLKDALRKLHDASKLTSFFRSGPKGSIPYMPDFVRLYNHMNKLSSKRDEADEKTIPQSFESVSFQTVVHRGVECDGCQMSPIQGNRYKCFACPDYDLCEICEEASKHPIDHPMLKIRSPISNRQFRGVRKTGLPRALFVEDRTLRDGISCYPGISVQKTWALKNNGESRWPQGVQLLFLSGDLAPESVKAVPRAEPGAIVEVSAAIKLPLAPKQYTGYYRLATEDGKKFGPRFWVDVIVVAPMDSEEKAVEEKAVEEKAVELKKEQPVPEKPVDVPQTNHLPTPAPIPSDIRLVSPPVPIPSDIPQLEDVQSEVKGSPLDQARIHVQETQPPKEEQQTVEVTKQVESKKTEIPKKPLPSPYAAQLEILTGMGFNDAELNAYLLGNNEGNVQRVVEWIISHGTH